MSEKEWKIISEKTKKFADRCSKFLYKSYILNEKWIPDKNNPINLRIKIKNNYHLLIDDYTYKCNWIAVEKNNNIIGVVRYYCDTEELGFELEKFINLPQLITAKRKTTAEIGRISICNQYKRSPALIILLASLSYALEKNEIKYLFSSVKNSNVLNLYKKLNFNDITNDIENNKIEFKCNRFETKTNNNYHLLWAENTTHRGKLLFLYEKLKKRYSISIVV